MLARCVATLKPPPELTLSQWADRYRMLSAESSAEPGRWHTDKAPYQREIMDAIGDVEQEVTGNVKQTLTGNLEQTVTGDVLQTITGTVTRNVTGDVTLSINGASITISAGGDISITSPTKVEVSAPVLNAEGASGDVKVQSISLVQHKHTSAAPGSESSQPLP